MSDGTYAESILRRLLEYAPTAGFVVLLLLGGLLGSFLLRWLTRWVVRKSGLDALAERAGIAKALYAIGARKGLANLLGSVAWACGVLLTIAALADYLALDALSALSQLAVQYLPRLVAAAGILLVGISIASFLRALVRKVSKRRGDVHAPDFAAQLAFYSVLAVTFAVTADQAGLETGIISALIQIVLGLGLGGAALAFGLGFRSLFHDMGAKHYYERLAMPGDTLEFGEVRGTVVRYSPIAVILRTDRGEMIVPCHLLLEQPVRLLRIEDLEHHSADAGPERADDVAERTKPNKPAK